MTVRGLLRSLAENGTLNFVLTNRLPRALLTRFMGWFSKIEQPLVRDASIAAWRLFADLDLSDAKHVRFRSLHACFTRELAPGARPVDRDPAVLASPCDAIVGAIGTVGDGTLLQAKDMAYRIADLLCDDALAAAHDGTVYVTLRLTSSMYHRFHAPADLCVDAVTYVPGDVWNVNPPALARVARLFCRNERVVLSCRLADGGARLTLVPVAAILVASVRLHFLDLLLHLGYRGPRRIACDARLRRGEEMGWFEHGSTIVVLAPPGYEPCAGVRTGATVRAGMRLLERGAEAGRSR